jgi:uncharacterized protein (DUF983 family)
MINKEEGKPPGYFNLLKCKCPRCRKGNMFKQANPYRLKGFMNMHDHCAVCGQQFEIEVGFYFGAHYVSYALAVALCVTTFVAWFVLVGFSFGDNRFFYWMGVNAVVLIISQPYLQRLSRTVWLSFFVHYDKDWRTNPPQKGERVNSEMTKVW